MKTLRNFFKIFKHSSRRPPLPEPKPWNGKHELAVIKHEEYFGHSPGDYRTGWLWACTCGINNRHSYLQLPYTEGEAVLQWVDHRNLYKGIEQSNDN